ncbi:MAG: hypothetical protein JNM96_01040, partial [Bacteroidia bacterium]|nr:hypothetical protein [Bacteroidia bacterium]
MRLAIVTLLICFCSFIKAQTPTYDDLVFDEEEIGAAYRPAGKNVVNIKSKKGAGGMTKTPEVDAIKSNEISEIILVFTETSEDAAEKREDNNRERWENLLTTYPELFQFNTSYKNICQCVMGGDAEPLKPSQGFYIYYKLSEPKVVAAATPPVKEEVKEVAKTEKKAEAETTKTKEVKENKKEEVKKEEKKEVKEEKKDVVKAKEEEKEEDLSNETTDA